MLPDLPNLKRDIQNVLYRYLQVQVNKRIGIFNELSRQIIQEGDRLRVVRADGSIDDSELKRASAEMIIENSEAPRLTFTERIAKLNDVAEEMSRQMSEHLFGTLNEVLDKAGQVTSNKGRPLDPDAFFSVMEKIQLDFDESGKHHKLSIVVPPNLKMKMEQVLNQIDTDPELQKRYEEIILKKRIEWLDREASRKLVG